KRYTGSEIVEFLARLEGLQPAGAGLDRWRGPDLLLRHGYPRRRHGRHTEKSQEEKLTARTGLRCSKGPARHIAGCAHRDHRGALCFLDRMDMGVRAARYRTGATARRPSW